MEKYPDSFKKSSLGQRTMGRVYAGPDKRLSEPDLADIEDVYNGPDPDPEPEPAPEPQPEPMAPVYAGPDPEPMAMAYAGPAYNPAAIEGVYAGPGMPGVFGIGMAVGQQSEPEPDPEPFECVYAGPEMMDGGPGGIGRGQQKAQKEPDKKHSGIRGLFGKNK